MRTFDEQHRGSSASAIKTLDAVRHDVVILLLGEVDTGFVIWWRAANYATSIETMFDQAVERDSDFITELVRRGGRVVVVSAPLPTIKDGAHWGVVANLRREVTATQRERTELTLRFNRVVRGATRTLSIDLDASSLGWDGLVKGHLVSPDPSDHHYDRAAYHELLHKAVPDLDI